jgi:gluconokinase
MPYLRALMKIPGLRSPHEKVGGIVYFGRMIDKIRLNLTGSLPADYIANLGEGFDGMCVRFLGVDYASVVEQAKRLPDDQAILEWCLANGRRPTADDIEVWNEFMRKRGWNDAATGRLGQRKAESGFADRAEIQTFFDYIDADEERPPGAKI